MNDQPNFKYPTADAVARAIVKACSLCGENAITLAQGRLNSRARHYAVQALRAVYPSAYNSTIARCVGAIRSQHAYVTASKRGVELGTFKWWDRDIYEKVVEAVQIEVRPRKFQLVSSLGRRRTAVPASQCEDVTAELMGDPQRR